jgi:hypothetical protein
MYGNFVITVKNIRAFKCEEISLRVNYEECTVLSYVRVAIKYTLCWKSASILTPSKIHMVDVLAPKLKFLFRSFLFCLCN